MLKAFYHLYIAVVVNLHKIRKRRIQLPLNPSALPIEPTQRWKPVSNSAIYVRYIDVSLPMYGMDGPLAYSTNERGVSTD